MQFRDIETIAGRRLLVALASGAALAFSAPAFADTGSKAEQSAEMSGNAQASGTAGGSGRAAAETTMPKENMQISLDGIEMPASELIGMEVMTPENVRLGEVAGLIRRDDADNDVILRLEEENAKMGAIAGADDRPGGAEGEPAVVGGRTVAVPIESLTLAQGGGGLTIDMDALATADEFAYDQDLGTWTTRDQKSDQ